MKLYKLKFLAPFLFLLGCTPLWTGYEMQYFDGPDKAAKFVQSLDEKKYKYKIVKRTEVIEVQYKEIAK